MIINTSNTIYKCLRARIRLQRLFKVPLSTSSISILYQRVDAIRNEFPLQTGNNSAHRDLVIVMPEKLNETSDKNETMRIPKDGSEEIKFEKINLELAFKGLSQRMINFNDFLTELEDQSDSIKLRQLFKNIEKHLYPLDCAAAIVSALTQLDPQTYERREIYRLLSGYQEIRKERCKGKSKSIIIHNVKEDYDALSKEEKLLLSIYNPTKLSASQKSRPMDDSAVDKFSHQLQTKLMQFNFNLIQVDRSFSQTIDDPDILAQLSSDSLEFQNSHQRERAPFYVTATTYTRFMQICPDRATRHVIWQAYKRRCSTKGTPDYANDSLIDDIRAFRKDIALHLFYSNHLDRILNKSMALEKGRVEESLKILHKSNVPKLRTRLRELNDYASNNGFEDDAQQAGLQDHDVDYWMNKYTHDVIIGKNESQVRAHFPLNRVIQGVREFFNKYFGININPTTMVDKAKYFKVEFDQKQIGNMIFNTQDNSDALAMPSIRLLRLRDRNVDLNTLACNILDVSYHKHSATRLMSLRLTEIIELVYTWASAIQKMLYNHDLCELNNEIAMEPESVELFPTLCIAYVLNDPRILQACSSRDPSSKSTGDNIDIQFASRMVDSLSYFKPMRLWSDLYRAHLDVEAHSRAKSVGRLANEIYSVYSPFQLDPNNYDYCSMADIFASSRSGSLYAPMWSKLLTNFCLTQLVKENPTIGTSSDNGLSSIETGNIRKFNSQLVKALFSPETQSLSSKIENLFVQKFDIKDEKLEFI